MTTREKALEQACLLTTTGSIAYGLNHANSDLDQMGVFIAPTIKVAGLDWNTHQESWTNTSPEGDDLTMHEIGKYLRLCLGGNPTLIELLFMNEYDILTTYGRLMVDHRVNIISEGTLRKSYLGYAKSQFYRIQQEDPFKEKMARHTLRIARQGTSLLTTAGFNVKVDDPQEYFDLTKLPKEDMLEVIKKELYKLETCESVLRDYPNREAIADFLGYIRYEHC
jgi:predicted nucleotidyltransferase